MKNLLLLGLISLAALAGMAASTTASAAPLAATAYWSGAYFNNTTLSGNAALVRNDSEINFDWDAHTSPGSGITNAGNFSVRWTRQIDFATSGWWTFSTINDDGIRVWVDDRITIDAWYDQSPTTHSGQVELSAGTHTVRVEYYNRILGGTARLSFAPTASFPNWKAEYFSNEDLSGLPTLVRDESSINFDWGGGSPAAVIPSDHWSARWTRTLYLAGGAWRFTTTADDGVRLWVDNNLLIDRWYDHPLASYSGDITLGAGAHTVRMEFYERHLNAVARLSYSAVNVNPPATGVWRGQYYANDSLDGDPVVVRDDPSLHFVWGTASPADGIPPDHFSAKWDSTQMLPRSGNYTILVSADDGVRVWVDGVLVVDAWYDHSAALFSATRWLAAGAHKVHVEYYERHISAMVGVDVIPASSPVPTVVLPAPDTTVDNAASGWQSGGSEGDWHLQANGIGGNALWSYNNSYTALYYNWARWYPTLPRAGNYQVYAYIPGSVATTSNARYWIYHAGIYDVVSRAQGLYHDQWVSLGTYYFTAAGGEFVSLSDVTGEIGWSRTVVFDAIKFSPR